MPSTPKRVYWDACSWIAVIQNETIYDPETNLATEYRGRMCRVVIEAAEKNVIEIATSAFSLVEVCKSPEVKADRDEDRIRNFFANPWVLAVPLDTTVGSYARKLMLSGYPGLKPADASHLASAIFAKADEVHTFDAKLLNLSGKIQGLSGMPLRICKPEVPAPRAPLLEEIERAANHPPQA